MYPPFTNHVRCCISAAIILLLTGCTTISTSDPAEVVEIVTFNLSPGSTEQDFLAINHRVEEEHVAQQPGFVQRETLYDDKENRWLVLVYWRSISDAENSMASFSSAPATSIFMQTIDPSSMKMTRYLIKR